MKPYLIFLLLAACSAAAPASFAQPAQIAPSEARNTPLSEIHGAPVPASRPSHALDADESVRDGYEIAKSHFMQSRYDEASQRLQALADGPGRDVYDVQYLLATCRARRADFDGALAPAQAAVELRPSSVDANFLLASLELERGAFDLAVGHFRSATLGGETEINNPYVTLSWYYLGQLLSRSGYDRAATEAYAEFDDAIWDSHPEQRNVREIQALLANKPLGALLERLELLAKLQRRDEELRLLEGAQRRWPDDAQVGRLRIAALLEAGRAEEALAAADHWLSDAGQLDHFLPLALDAATKSGKIDEFVNSVVTQAEAGQRGDLAAALLPALISRRQFAPAVRVGAAAMKGIQTPEVVANYADALRLTGDVDGAIQALAEFVRQKPNRADSLCELIRRWRGGSPSGFLDAVVKSRGGPQDAARDYVLGVLARASSQPALAEKLFSDALRVAPDFPPAQLGRARLMFDAFDWSAAQDYAKTLLDNAPESAVANFISAEAHDGLDENEAAESAYKKALKTEPENSAIALALARHYRRLGEWVSAERFLQRALTSDSQNGEAFEELIDAYVASNKIDIARSEVESQRGNRLPPDTLRRIATTLRFADAPYGPDHLTELRSQHEQHPDDVKTTIRYALALGRSDQGDVAAALLAGVCATNPNDLDAAVLLATLQGMRLQFDEAVARLQGFVKRYPNRVALLSPLARMARYDFQTDLARETLKRLLTLDPPNAETYRITLLNSYLAFGEADVAVKLVDEWLAEKPDSPQLLQIRIDALLLADRASEAFEIVKERLTADESSEEWRSRLIDVGRAAKAYREVEQRLRAWLDAAPGDIRLTTALILTLISDKRPDEALQAARDFSGGFREAITQRIWFGMCHVEAGRYEEAIKEYQALLRERTLDESQREVVRGDWRGALVRAKRYDEAVTLCDEWLAEAKKAENVSLTYEALTNKAAVLQAAGRENEYMATMEAMYAINPGSVSISNDLGYSWVDHNKNLEQATRMIRAAVSYVDERGEGPMNAAYLDSLGWAFYKTGDFSNARKYLARAAKLRDGQDGVIFEHLGDAEQRLGDQESARKRWKKALEFLEKDALSSDRPPDAERIAALRTKLTSPAPKVAETITEAGAKGEP